MNRIRDAFRAQNLSVPDEIVALLHHEVTVNGASPGPVEQRAIDLWKNQDIRVFYSAQARLPSCLKRVVKQNVTVQIIKESFCLQIDSLRDISRPAYQQLQIAINRYGENVLMDSNAEVAPNSKAATKVEENGNRMLLLNLTDGLDDIQAMEYVFIHEISVSIPPGTKIRLIPPIICRKGVLLLKPPNIQIIGGHVPSLLEKFAQKRVLATQLNANLEQLEKSAPPCPPPNAAPALPATQASQVAPFRPARQNAAPLLLTQAAPFRLGQTNAARIHVNLADDPEGDALMAAFPDDDDAFLGAALDQYDADNP